MQMNEVRLLASGGVQRVAASVACMISVAGHPAGEPRDPMEEETAMFKTISAALLAVSVLAAPALAASPGKSTHAPVIKAEQSKSKFVNANARMGRHHHKHLRHHRHHTHMGMLKTHGTPKFAIKHATHAKRG
jgi:hypothetical protein